MPRYQKLYTQIWHDEKFLRLSEKARYLFMYILTCPHSNSIGLFVLPKAYVAADLGWSPQQLREPFEELLREQLILYDESVSLICVKNHVKHNPIENEKQAIGAKKNICHLPHSPLYSTLLIQLDKQYHKPLKELLTELYAIPEEETEEETEEEYTMSGKPDSASRNGAVPYEEIITDLNEKSGKKYRHTTKVTRDVILARWNEGFRLDDFKLVNANVASRWLDDEKMNQFLRPDTLYRASKFEGYLNLGPKKQEKKFL